MEIQNNQRGNLMNEITNIVEKPTLLQQQDIELSKLIIYDSRKTDNVRL